MEKEKDKKKSSRVSAYRLADGTLTDSRRVKLADDARIAALLVLKPLAGEQAELLLQHAPDVLAVLRRYVAAGERLVGGSTGAGK